MAALGAGCTVAGGGSLEGTVVEGLCTDSRTVKPGDLFVALRGERFDGHEFVPEAFARGAVAAVVCRGSENHLREVDRPLLLVEDTLRALGELARFHRRHFDIPLLALTGTVGKTTAKEFIAAVLSRRFRVLKNESSYNNVIGVSLTLARLDAVHQLAVCELGTNHPGEIRALCSLCEPTVGLILNVGRGHLEFFGSVEGVRREKYELANWLRERGLGPVFLNADDPVLRSQPPQASEIVWFGQAPDANVRVVLESEEDGRAVVRFGEMRVQLPIPGLHHLCNAAAAVAVGRHFGIPDDAIAEGLSTVSTAPHRGQVERVGGVVLVDDAYNCNPESARAACRTLAKLEGRRRIFVFGDMLELGEAAESEHEALGRELRSLGVDALFAFGPLAERTASSARGAGLPSWHFAEKTALVEALANYVQPGDAVLFKGSRGMRMEEALEGLKSRLAEEGEGKREEGSGA